MSTLYLVITQVGTSTSPPWVNAYHSTVLDVGGRISTDGFGTSIPLTSTSSGIDIADELGYYTSDITEIQGFVLTDCKNASDSSTTGSNLLTFVDDNGTSSSANAQSKNGFNFNTGSPASLTRQINPLPYLVNITFTVS